MTKTFQITEAGSGYLVTKYTEGEVFRDLFVTLDNALQWIKLEWEAQHE